MALRWSLRRAVRWERRHEFAVEDAGAVSGRRALPADIVAGFPEFAMATE
jgi:hypothetical protein